MAKSFIIMLKKNEFSNTDYTFSGINKVDGITIISEINFGKPIYSPRTAVVEIDSEQFGNLFNQKISPGECLKVKFDEKILENKQWIFIKLNEDILSKFMIRAGLSERAFLCKLMNIFKNVDNFSLNNEQDYNLIWAVNEVTSITFNFNSTLTTIDENDQLITGILTEGKKNKAVNDADVRRTTTAANPNVGRTPISQLDPDDIIAKLRKKIVGQDKFIQDVVDTMFMNQEVIDMNDPDLIKTHKANIFIDGPTGTGKSFLIDELCIHLSLPMVVVSTTTFSTVGYKGADLESILIRLLDAANGNLELAERGIIALDEFDKLGNNNKNNELAIRKGIQEELLTYLSGAKFRIRYKDKDIDFDTSKITFVAMGAFTNLRKRKIEEKEKKSNVIGGFGSSLDSKANNTEDRTYTIEHKDYVEEGIMEELIGRFTTLTNTSAWTKERLITLMKTSDTSPLIGTQKIVSKNGKTLEVSDDVLEIIAELALEMSTGARALSTIFNPITRTLMRQIRNEDIDVDVITITPDLVNLAREQRKRSY